MEINLNFIGNLTNLQDGLNIIASRLNINISEKGINVKVNSDSDKLIIERIGDAYELSYSFKAEFFRGLALIVDSIKNDKSIKIKEKRKFKTSGSMLDVSRGHVFKKEVIFDLLERMALMGLDMFMLYTEDTYEMENYPWFGYMRGAYTNDELKEIDDYAYKLGIEVIPCIQTLAHLKTYLRWPTTRKYRDTSDVLLVGEDETYELIDEMFKTCRKCFRTDRIHIGLDEAFGIGTGQYKKINGERPTSEIMTEHLNIVCQLSNKYNYKPMLWSDMFFRLSGQKGEYDLAAEIPANLATDLPKDIEMVYWDYCMEDRVVTDTVIKMHKQMKRPVVFAGGVWSWNRIVTAFRKSYISSREQLISCAANDVDTAFMTVWNNEHAAFSLYTILPALQMWAELSYNPEAEMDFIAERFEACTGYDFESWQTLFVDDFTDEELKEYKDQAAYCVNCSQQQFFKDILNPIMDKTLSLYDFKSRYAEFKKNIANVKPCDLDYIFDINKVLYEIIYIKADLGDRLRSAYKSGDKNMLSELYDELQKLLVYYKEYHMLTRKMWFKLCKPFGFNSLDMEIGMVVARVDTAIYRLKEYIEGRIDSLPECENEVYLYNEKDKPLMEIPMPRTNMTVY